jgi:hypothetical protein
MQKDAADTITKKRRKRGPIMMIEMMGSMVFFHWLAGSGWFLWVEVLKMGLLDVLK